MIRYIIIFLFIFNLFLPASPVKAVTRGQALHEVMTALAIPTWEGHSFSDIPENHKYAKSIDTAFAMGILFPSDRFYPDIEITRIEALAFSFRAMGWGHEAELVQSLLKTDRELPQYLTAYAYLANTVTPSPPDIFKVKNKKNMTEEDLHRLGKWLQQCLSKGLLWQAEIANDKGKLIIHREGIGRPSQGWSVVLAEIDSIGEGKKKVSSLLKKGIRTHLQKTDCSIELRAGPFKNYAKAWLFSKNLPSSYRSSPIISSGQGTRKTIFWTAIVGTPSSFSIATSPSLGAYKLPLSEIGERSKSTGAINGGFFYGKSPIGSLVIDGVPVTIPYKDRSAIGWNHSDRVFFGSGKYRLSLETERGSVPISTVNTLTSNNRVGLYTPHFGQFALSARGKGFEFTVKDERITGNRDSKSSNHFMKLNETLLKVNSSGPGLLADAKKAKVRITWDDRHMTEARQVIQAGPMLFGLDKPFSREHFSSSIIEKRHPRTLACWNGTNIWWIVIDGRSSWHSSGATLSEAAFIAQQLGMKQAVNLDGGGSSEIWWSGLIINKPSGGRERPLPYAIVF